MSRPYLLKKTLPVLGATLLAALACAPLDGLLPDESGGGARSEGFKPDISGMFESSERPSLSGSPTYYDTDHFRIHYTTSGNDAVLPGDSNGNGLPDYVENVASAMEESYRVEVTEMGWAAPPSDGQEGGDNRFDVYLENIFGDGTAGYADGGFDEMIVGDNPNTAPLETNASWSYMALDNDFAELDDYEVAPEGVVVTVEEYMRSTAAHEFMHAIQYGYDSGEPADWMWEAIATWVQDEVYDDVNDANEELVAVFKSPDTCQVAYGGEERIDDENHWYGMWVFFRYLSERHGRDVVREVWESTVSYDGYDALDATLQARGSSLDGELDGFFLSLLTRNYDEGADYPTVRLQSEIGLGNYSPPDGVGQVAADYIEITAGGKLTVQLSGSGMRGTLVGVAGNGATPFPMDANQGVIDANAYERVYLIVANHTLAADEYDCEWMPYSVNVSQGGTPSVASESLFAPNFVAPNSKGVEIVDAGEAAIFGGGTDGGGEDIPFEAADVSGEWLPAYVPANYDYDGAYVVYPEDFGNFDESVWYIPADVEGTALDYYGPGRDDYLTVVYSASPYRTLDDWLVDLFDEADFEPFPEELVTINGVDVLLVDWGEEGDPFASANFIVNGQFFSVDGTLSPKQIRLVVESLLE